MARNAKLEQSLRQELKAANIRWCRTYADLNDRDRWELLVKMIARRLEMEKVSEACERKRRDEPVESDYEPEIVPTTTMHGTGGGHRVIRSTRGLS